MLQAVIVMGVLLITCLAWWYRRPTGMPPGPPRSLLGDNTLDVPAFQPWKKFTEWNRTYGTQDNPPL